MTRNPDDDLIEDDSDGTYIIEDDLPPEDNEEFEDDEEIVDDED